MNPACGVRSLRSGLLCLFEPFLVSNRPSIIVKWMLYHQVEELTHVKHLPFQLAW